MSNGMAGRRAGRIYAALNVGAALLSAGAGAVAWRRRRAPAAGPYAVKAGLTVWWCLCSAALAFVRTPRAEYALVRLAWVAVALSGPADYAVAARYADPAAAWPWRRWLRLSVVPALTLVALATNTRWGLLWRGVSREAGGPAAGFARSRAPWWYVQAAYSYALQAVAVVRIGRAFREQARGVYRGQAALLAVGLAAPMAGNLLSLARVRPRWGDLSAAGTALGAVALAGAVFGRRLLRAMPLAQAVVLDGLADGIVVLDARDRVLDLNPAAQRLAGTTPDAAIGRPLAAVLPALAARLAAGEAPAGDEPPAGAEDLKVVGAGGPRWFAVRASPLRDSRGRPLGRAVVLAETTDRRRVGDLERSRAQMVAAEERLRLEIAEALHGGVQTRLLVAGYRLAAARAALAGAAADPARADALLAELGGELEDIRERDVRRVSHRLHPAVIRLGLLPAVEDLADDYAGGLPVTVRAGAALGDLDDPVSGRLPDDVRLAAYRVVEEALVNAQRHAGASRAVVELDVDASGALLVAVTDDGRGLAPGVRGPDPGLGLNALAARVHQLGGTWTLEGAPGGGTRLTARLPVATDSPPGSRRPVAEPPGFPPGSSERRGPRQGRASAGAPAEVEGAQRPTSSGVRPASDPGRGAARGPRRSRRSPGPPPGSSERSE